MPTKMELREFLAEASGGAMFDVRTPAEFHQGHIPGAVNLPLFSNEERAVVGTAYKQEGRHAAIKIGLDLIGPRMRELVEVVETVAGPPSPETTVYVHCWRGGMRSGSLAWLLELYGYDVRVLGGGYKAFRRWVLATLEEPPPLVVLGGRTGSGKTLVLHALDALGEPVLDLEGLAHHRGSAFGALMLPPQPTQEQFEAVVALRLAELAGATSPVWVEDESRMVGTCMVPNTLMAAMREAHTVAMDVPTERRVDVLVEIYGDAPTEGLADSFSRITKRLGLDRTREALAALEAGDLREAARIGLSYYDKTYDYGLSKREPTRLHWLPINDDDIESFARRACEVAATLQESE